MFGVILWRQHFSFPFLYCPCILWQYRTYCILYSMYNTVYIHIADKEPEDPEQHVRGEPGHLRPRHDDHPGKPGRANLEVQRFCFKHIPTRYFWTRFPFTWICTSYPKVVSTETLNLPLFFLVWVIWKLGWFGDWVVLYIQHVHLLGLILPLHNVSATVLEAYC